MPVLSLFASQPSGSPSASGIDGVVVAGGEDSLPDHCSSSSSDIARLVWNCPVLAVELILERDSSSEVVEDVSWLTGRVNVVVLVLWST